MGDDNSIMAHNGGIVQTLAAQAVKVPVWKSKKLASNNQPAGMAN